MENETLLLAVVKAALTQVFDNNATHTFTNNKPVLLPSIKSRHSVDNEKDRDNRLKEESGVSDNASDGTLICQGILTFSPSYIFERKVSLLPRYVILWRFT